MTDLQASGEQAGKSATAWEEINLQAEIDLEADRIRALIDRYWEPRSIPVKDMQALNDHIGQALKNMQGGE